MSTWPWPERLKRITRGFPSFFASSASSTAARMACEDSGAGMMASVRANCTAPSKQGSRHAPPRPLCAARWGGKEGEARAAEVGAAAVAADDHVGVVAGELELLLGLE